MPPSFAVPWQPDVDLGDSRCGISWWRGSPSPGCWKEKLMTRFPPSLVGYQGWQQEQHLGMQHSSRTLGVNVNGAELLGEMIKFFE